MKVFDVIGTTCYTIGTMDDAPELEDDCFHVVLPAAFGDMHMAVGQCEFAEAYDEYRNAIPIDWIVSLTAPNEEAVRLALAESEQTAKQYSFIYEINDVTDDVGGVEKYITDLKGV